MTCSLSLKRAKTQQSRILLQRPLFPSPISSWSESRRQSRITLWRARIKEAPLRQCQELGVERIVFLVPSEGKDTLLPLLDQYAAVIPKFA